MAFKNSIKGFIIPFNLKHIPITINNTIYVNTKTNKQKKETKQKKSKYNQNISSCYRTVPSAI